MELRQVRYFVALADALNFARAATQLRIAQPSLSRQIARLETELQARLFARTTRRVQLTESGRLFLDEAREILAHADRAALAARRAGAGEAGTLRIGCAYWIDATRVLASLASFHRRHRTVRFDVQILGSLQQAAALRDARLDAAFLRSPASEPSLDSMVLMSEPLLAALPARHRLAARERVAISDLGAELFILPPRTAVPILHDLVLKLCRDAGFVPNVAHEIDHPSMVLGLVGAGIGVSLVPASARRLRPRGVVLKRLRPSPRVLQTALAWRRDPASPLVSSFVEAVRPQWPGR